MEHDMGKMTVKEVREYLRPTRPLSYPTWVGEQHGYHLPLSMDIHNVEISAYALVKLFSHLN